MQSLFAFLILLTFNLNAILLGHRLAGDRRGLPIRQALHLVAAGSSLGSPSTGGRAAFCGRRRREAWAGRRCCSTSAASPGRCSTTRSTPTRTAEDDALIGVKSTARLFAENTGLWLRGFLVATVTLMGAGRTSGTGPGLGPRAGPRGWRESGGWGWHMVWQMQRLDIDDEASACGYSARTGMRD